MLQKAVDVRIHSHYPSDSSPNVHILQFADEAAIEWAMERIEEIQKRSEFWGYLIIFRQLSEADINTKRQVGYIAQNHLKPIYLDFYGKQDPISILLRQKLISQKQCSIELAVLDGNHSYILGRKMSEFVENVICVHPYVDILDSTAGIFKAAFHETMQRNQDEETPISQLAFIAFVTAKRFVQKECKRDKKCKSHSHCNPSDHEERYEALHLGPFQNEKWNELQRIMDSQKDDFAEFRWYRSKMMEIGVVPKEELDLNLYDRCTLKICNVSKDKMNGLQQYLCDALTAEEMQEHDITERNGFVVQSIWQKDSDFEELSVGYFKFQSTAHRNLAKRKLSRKQKEEALVFSERIHKRRQRMAKDGEHEFGWYHRVVPRCCCSPQHPHLVQDKFIFIHNGQIISRHAEEMRKINYGGN